MARPPIPLTTLLGKTVREVAKLRGGGSALPGLFVETIDKDFLATTLAQLPLGVILVSGTNGKTTTTKMVVELLQSQGLKVFTNRTGSNFTRGVVAALLNDIDLKGRLNADIAVLELDEAHAVRFVKAVQPRYSLLLNVMRDQLDRFGEIDATAGLLSVVAEHTSQTVVVNREDPRLVRLASDLPTNKVEYFGLDPSLRQFFPDDDSMRGHSKVAASKLTASSVLKAVDGHKAKILLHNHTLNVNLKLDGIYNIFNAAAAIGLVSAVLGKKLDTTRLTNSLETITPAFGRGEILTVNGQPLELVLVKNPGGFRLGLQSFDPTGYATMIAINDNYADGRDMSWLWDVNFDSLKEAGVAAVTGIRAYDMALRLQYEEVEVAFVDTNLKKSLDEFIIREADKPKRIYCSYTAMLALRRELGKTTELEAIS